MAVNTDARRIVTIFGGSGFVGRYIARRMARLGWRVRVAVRRPYEAHFVKPYGDVGQVIPVQANIRDEASTRAAIDGADVVINCVGILYEDSRQKFDAVQDEGAGRIARLAADCGVGRFVHLSAICDPETGSAYAATKLAGEAAVRAAFPGAVILKPSVIFGPEDQFFNRFAAMSRMTLALPLVGADTRFQPVYVDDVAQAAVAAATSDAHAGETFELGGPEVATFRELMESMLRHVRRRRLLVALPEGVARMMAWGFGVLETLTFGLFPNRMITGDQIRNLSSDNLVAEGALGLSDLGVTATPMEAVLERYLYTYRPHGQFDAITESASDLRN